MYKKIQISTTQAKNSWKKSWKEYYHVTLNKKYKESTKMIVNSTYHENYLSIIRTTLTRKLLKSLDLPSKYRNLNLKLTYHAICKRD